MNLNLNDEDLKQVKACLSGIADTRAEIAELNQSIKDYKEKIAELLDCKPGKISGIIKGYLQKLDGIEPSCFNDSLILEKVCGEYDAAEDDTEED